MRIIRSRAWPVSLGQKCRGILPIEGSQFGVELGMSFFEDSRLFEEAFRCDSEEFGVVGGAVFVEDSGPPHPAFAFEPLVLGIQNASPGNILTALIQERGPVHGAVFSIQLMGKLMEHQISAILNVRRTCADFIPRQHDDPVGPRFTQVHVLTFQSKPASNRLDGSGNISAGIDEHRGEPGVDVSVTVKQEQARLGGYRHLDLVGQNQPAAAFENLLGEEDLDQSSKLEPVGLGKARVKSDVLLDDRQPVSRKGRRLSTDCAFAA